MLLLHDDIETEDRVTQDPWSRSIPCRRSRWDYILSYSTARPVPLHSHWLTLRMSVLSSLLLNSARIEIKGHVRDAAAQALFNSNHLAATPTNECSKLVLRSRGIVVSNEVEDADELWPSEHIPAPHITKPRCTLLGEEAAYHTIDRSSSKCTTRTWRIEINHESIIRREQCAAITDKGGVPRRSEVVEKELRELDIESS